MLGVCCGYVVGTPFVRWFLVGCLLDVCYLLLNSCFLCSFCLFTGVLWLFWFGLWCFVCELAGGS